MKLFNDMVHVLNDTTRHAGHADILREQLDGQTGVAAGHQEQIDTAARKAHGAKIECFLELFARRREPDTGGSPIYL